MKEVIYNSENIKEEEINRIQTRIKAVIENSKGEILICNSKNNYQLPGGHLEENETYVDCLIREFKEETGASINIDKLEPFFSITYLNKNYPESGINTKSLANYYSIKCDLIHNIDNLNLTEEEKEGNFNFKYVKKEEILDLLINSLEYATMPKTVEDTILVLKEYLKK